MFLKYCTITGIDEKIDLDRINTLSIKYPFVEWGILYSPTNRTSRYPSISFISKCVNKFNNLSMHVCGKGVDNFISNEYDFVESMLDSKSFKRVQLNFNAVKKEIDFYKLRSLMEIYSDINFITQHNKNNENVWKNLVYNDNHHLLFDSSGGRGLSNSSFSGFIDGKFCGYAGGINPNNIEKILKIISQYTYGICWIDMESGVRTDDYLDLDKVEYCLKMANSYA